MQLRNQLVGGAVALTLALMPSLGGASSHREAPFITKNPKVDGTDFYMFNSYEGASRDGYVTILANYLPLQDAYGGPNYFSLDPDAIYEIHIDNTGDGVEDVTFQFDFDVALANGGTGFELPISGKNINIPLVVKSPVSSPTDEDLNLLETYKLNVIYGPRRTGTSMPVANLGDSTTTFRKPLDNTGTKTIADYDAYASQFVSGFDVPGCTVSGVQSGTTARVFVGQRREGFAVNLGQIFDLVNMGVSALGATPTGGQADLTGAIDQGMNTVANKNVTTLALEVPASCLNKTGGSIIAGWTTASVRQARVINPTGTFATPAREGGPWVQVSRLGMPLVNEVVIGLKDKNKWNGSVPSGDGQFADYVTHPSLPILVEVAFGATGALAPTTYPRSDLVAVFLNGVPTVNVLGPTLFEALRLNTAPSLITRRADQSTFGAVTCFDPPADDASGPTLNLARTGCDPAGFPNGRRPGDDTVDIALRTVMGFLLPMDAAPLRAAPLVDGANLDALDFQNAFPYLNSPIAGAP